MYKEEIIKILVENMNELKGNNNEYRKLLEEFEGLDDIIKEHKGNSRIRILIIFIQSLLCINCIINDYDYLFPVACLLYMLLTFNSGIEKDRIEKNVKCDINLMKKILSTNTTKIENLQMAVEFLQGLTEEEEKKYLNLKF